MFRRRHKSTSFAVAYLPAREIAARLKGETRPDGSGNYACRSSEIIVELATAPGNDFFHTDLDDGFAYVGVGKHRETFKIGSKYFSLWLTEKFYRATGEAPSKVALEQAVATLKAKARTATSASSFFSRLMLARSTSTSATH